MTCKEAKKSELLYWEQPERVRQELDAHQQDCPECQRSFQGLARSIELCRQILQTERKLEDFSHYWNRLCKRLVKPSWPERMAQWGRSGLDFINRSIWGPVPAYAVVGMVLIAFFAILPLSHNSRSVLRPNSAFRSSLVVEQFEPDWAKTQDGLTIYTLAQSTPSNPAPNTAAGATLNATPR